MVRTIKELTNALTATKRGMAEVERSYCEGCRINCNHVTGCQYENGCDKYTISEYGEIDAPEIQESALEELLTQYSPDHDFQSLFNPGNNYREL